MLDGIAEDFAQAVCVKVPVRDALEENRAGGETLPWFKLAQNRIFEEVELTEQDVGNGDVEEEVLRVGDVANGCAVELCKTTAAGGVDGHEDRP